MAWSVLQSAGGLGSGASTVQTYTSNVSAGTKLIAYFSAFSATNITMNSVKDGAGNTFTQVGWLWSATSGTGAGIFAMDTPAGDVGTKPVITALLSNGSFGAMVIQEVSGLAAGNTLAAMVDGTAAATAFAAGASHAQPAYSSTAAGEFLVSFCGDQGGPQTMTQPAGYTLDAHAVNNSASADCCPAYKNSAGGAESGTWSYAGSTVGSNIVVAAFQLAAASGGAAPAARYAPGWHPGRLLPGMPGGVPFARPALPGTSSSVYYADTYPAVYGGPPAAVYADTYPAVYGGPETPAAHVPAPLRRPVTISRVPSRARVGPSGRSGGGIASRPSAVVTARAVASPAALAATTRPAPARARVGPMANRSGSGVASAVVTPLGQPSRPRPFIFRSPAPARARTGPAGSTGGGIASPAITPLGSMPRPMPRPVIQHLPPSRGQAGPLGLAGAGLASSTVTPRGTPGPGWRPQPRRPAPARAVWRGGAAPQAVAPVVTAYRRPPAQFPRRGPARAAWHGNAGPAAVAPAAPQAYQRPAPQIRRPGPARAVTGRGRTGGGQAGPANAAPVTTAVIRPPAQPRSRPPQRAVWHGNASHVVTPLGAAARRPGPVITSRPRRRGLWHGNTGPVPSPASAPPPRWRPLPSRRRPQRARTGGVRGLANAAPPVVTYGTARQGTMTIPAAESAQAAAARAQDGTGAAAAYTPAYPAVYGSPAGHAQSGTGTAAEAAYGPLYAPAYGSPPGHAQAGQMTLPRAQ